MTSLIRELQLNDCVVASAALTPCRLCVIVAVRVECHNPAPALGEQVMVSNNGLTSIRLARDPA
ncbi:hypothetical protein CKO25_10045 [Thiocapsa imhoffii]|uniref:Uncharacterized protein n=1 Tax=Thiocapsa imhoffii TaxID=382777 RepID=A0A9X0WI57_9GAMM|nr:hypothetical protein [Thiocapsa imhoffii]